MADLLDTGADLLFTGDGTATGDNDKVAVDAASEAGYLADVLVSDSDLVTLVNANGQIRIQVNTELSYDPKLSTMEESQIDAATTNYGGYSLKSGKTLAWGDTAFETFDWLNAQVHQMTRIAASQGTVTKCNLALCGTLAFSDPPPCLNVGIFSLDGTLLGTTGLRKLGTDFNSGVELCSFDMAEEATGSLSLRRNERYIVQVWTCGLQLAALDRSAQYNYTYDYELRQNMEGTISLPTFQSTAAAFNRASAVPFVNFGAVALN